MDELTKQCPYCGETININAKKCRYCGEWLNKEETETPKIHCPYCGEDIQKGLEICPLCNEKISDKIQGSADKNNKAQVNLNENQENTIKQESQANILSEEARIGIIGSIGLIALIAIGITFFALFNNPLGELTSGCTSNGDVFNVYGGETFYCKNKPWASVNKKINSNAPAYTDYTVYSEDNGEIGYFSWYKGEYVCRVKEYVRSGSWGWRWTYDEKYLGYDGPCTEREFIQKLKETIERAEILKKRIEAEKSTIEEDSEIWDEWRENLGKKIIEDVKLTDLQKDSILKFSFYVDALGRISEAYCWLVTGTDKTGAGKYLEPILEYSGKDFMKFPTNSNLASIYIKGFAQISNKTVSNLGLSIYKNENDAQKGKKLLIKKDNKVEKKEGDNRNLGSAGIGTQIGLRNNSVTVLQVFENMPASNAGIKVGDIILKVDGNTVDTVEDSASKTRGEDNTKVEVTVLRENKELSFTIKRKKFAPLDLNKYKQYRNDASKMILNNWNPPEDTTSQSIVAQAIISKDGTLLNASISQSSGDDKVDKSLIDAIEKTRFKPLSFELSGILMGFEFGFEYKGK